MEDLQKHPPIHTVGLQYKIGVPGMALLTAMLHHIVELMIYTIHFTFIAGDVEIGIGAGIEFSMSRLFPALLLFVASYFILKHLMKDSRIFFRSWGQPLLFVLIWVVVNALPYILGDEAIQYFNDLLMQYDWEQGGLWSLRNIGHMVLAMFLCLLSLGCSIAVFSAIWSRKEEKAPVEHNVWTFSALTALFFFMVTLFLGSFFWEDPYMGNSINMVLMQLIAEWVFWGLFFFLPAGIIVLLFRKKQLLFSDIKAVLGGSLLGIAVPFITVGLLWLFVAGGMLKGINSIPVIGLTLLVLFYGLLGVGCLGFRKMMEGEKVRR